MRFLKFIRIFNSQTNNTNYNSNHIKNFVIHFYYIFHQILPEQGSPLVTIIFSQGSFIFKVLTLITW